MSDELSADAPVSHIVSKFAAILTDMLNYMRHNDLSNYLTIFKKLSDELCTQSENNVYHPKKVFTTRDEVVVHRDTLTCVHAWLGSKAQREKYGKPVIHEMNNRVAILRSMYLKIPHRENRPSSDYDRHRPTHEHPPTHGHHQKHELEKLLCMLTK